MQKDPLAYALRDAYFQGYDRQGSIVDAWDAVAARAREYGATTIELSEAHDTLRPPDSSPGVI